MRHFVLIAHPSQEVRTQLRNSIGEHMGVFECVDVLSLKRIIEQKKKVLSMVIFDFIFLPEMKSSRDQEIDDDIPVVITVPTGNTEYENYAYLWGAHQVVQLPINARVAEIKIRTISTHFSEKRSLKRIISEQKNEIHNTSEYLIDALSAIIECRSLESGRHVRRIRAFTHVLLEEIETNCPEYNLDAMVIRRISGAAALHDIGKISIPDSILNKPSKLTEEEFEIMKTHSVAGGEIIEHLGGIGNDDFIRYAYNICRYHHERWDGGGYPEGLAGDDIPICAQVVGLADAYDALTSKRVYKDAYSCEKAARMIIDGQCGLFSPMIIECFKNVSSEFAYLAKIYSDGKIDNSDEIRDVTAPIVKTYANNLQELRLKYEIIIRHLNSLVIELDLETNKINYVYNPDTSFDYLRSTSNSEQAISLMAENSVHPDDKDMLTIRFQTYLKTFFDSGLKKSLRRYRMQDKNGVYRYYNVTTYRLDDSSKKIIGVWDEAPEEITKAERDALTDLLNKESSQRLTEEHLAENTDGQISALIIIDLDNFKNVNDRYGHLFGDEVLSRISREIGRLFRSTDVVGRIGGDEFMVFTPNISDCKLISERCETLIKTTSGLFEGHMQELGLSCSIGIAFSPEHGTAYTELFRHADIALYRAKHLGKNRAVVYEALFQMPTFSSEISQRIDSDDSPWNNSNLPSFAFDLLYESGDMITTINHLISIVGTQMNVSRVYIFENNADNTECSNTFEWCNEGISAEIDSLKHVSYITDIPGYENHFNEHGIFYCSNIETLPIGEREILQAQGIKAILQCAIRDGGKFRGYVGFDDNISTRLWTKEQVDVLNFLSRIMSIYLLKYRNQEETKKMLEGFRNVLNNQYAWLYIVDPDTYKICFFNDKTQELIPQISGEDICYKILMGRDKPCENCLIARKSRVDIDNFYLGVKVTVKAEMIQWEGKQRWLITCREKNKVHE